MVEVTDSRVGAAIRAFKFFGLCLFYGLLLQNKGSSERAKNLIEKEYHED